MGEKQGTQKQGIKLFGQTIVLQVKEEQFQEQPTSCKDGETTTDDQSGENGDQEAINKRPDKIIPCPRCKSMETKFCYFNNYNVNQPRHFCKGCQRYWTAGGALRNVPVGAGRRKSKPPGRGGGFGDEGCLFDGMNLGGQLIDLNGVVVDEWQLAAAVAAGGGFRHHGFQVKRRRNDESPGQTC